MFIKSKFAMPLMTALALALAGCGGSDSASSGSGGGGGGNPGTAQLDLAIAANGANTHYAKETGTNGTGTTQITLSDPNPGGDGILTIIGIVPDGTTGRIQSVALAIHHPAALSAGQTLTLDSSSSFNYTEMTTGGTPPKTTTLQWLGTTGTVKVTARTAKGVSVQIVNMSADPNKSAGPATGSPTFTGTASGDLTANV